MFMVIVTEKPSVAQEHIKTLKIKGKREEGYAGFFGIYDNRISIECGCCCWLSWQMPGQ